MSKRPFVAVVFGLSLVGLHVSHGKTWYVGGAGADFTDIPPAIAAASHGDVIIVRPGTYSGFTLDKGVIIRSSSDVFAVTDDILVTGISSGHQAGISGISSHWIAISNCDGEVVLERIYPIPGSQYGLGIQNSSNVAVTHLITTKSYPTIYPWQPPAAVSIGASRVRIADSLVRGFTGYDFYGDTGGSGGHGLHCANSLVWLADTTVIGGPGGDGYTTGTGFYCFRRDAGAGGDGIVALSSTVIAASTGDDLLLGGKGGTAYSDFACPFDKGRGGDGGNGFTGSSLVYSRIQLAGGLGGDGIPPGQDGEPYFGDARKDDSIPVLDMTGEQLPGSTQTVSLDAVSQSYAILLFSNVGGFVRIDNFYEPAWWWSVLPGSYFLVIPVVTNTVGDFSASFEVTDSPAAEGLVIQAQAVVFESGGSQRSFLSNAVVRVVGED